SGAVSWCARSAARTTTNSSRISTIATRTDGGTLDSAPTHTQSRSGQAAHRDAPPAMAGATALFRHAVRIAWKDLRIELRSREIVYTMTFFGALLVVIFTFAFPRDPNAVRGSLPGMLWTAIAFAGTIGLSRAFDRERENDTMRALLLAPVPRLAVFLGKAAAICVLVVAVAVVVAPLLALFLSAPLFAVPGPVVLVLLLG